MAIFFGVTALFYLAMFGGLIWFWNSQRLKDPQRSGWIARVALFSSPPLIFAASAVAAILFLPSSLPVALTLGLWPMAALFGILLWTSASKRRMNDPDTRL